jgi:hypothetical protein
MATTRKNGPTGHPFVNIDSELLVRWTGKTSLLHNSDPQGVALGWVN